MKFKEGDKILYIGDVDLPFTILLVGDIVTFKDTETDENGQIWVNIIEDDFAAFFLHEFVLASPLRHLYFKRNSNEG